MVGGRGSEKERYGAQQQRPETDRQTMRYVHWGVRGRRREARDEKEQKNERKKERKKKTWCELMK
jgi:hypothetical protein